MNKINPTWVDSTTGFYQFIIPTIDDGFFTDDEKYILVCYKHLGMSLEDFIGATLDMCLTDSGINAYDSMLGNLLNGLQVGETLHHFLPPPNDSLKNELQQANECITSIIDKLKNILACFLNMVRSIGQASAIDISHCENLDGYVVDVWYDR